MAAPQIPLHEILAAMDRKDRNYYDNLPEHLKKKFSGFLMLQWEATISGTPEMQHYYIASVNHYANKNMFDLYHHPKLQWLMLTAASPGVGKQKHNWLKRKPKPKNATAPIKKELAAIYPNMKDDDLETLSKITTKKDLKQYARDHGES